MDRALFYAVMIGGTYSLCMLLLLDSVPIAACSGILVGMLAMLRGVALWGR